MGGRKAPEEQRRDEIVRAAFAVAAREGLAGVTARSVAAQAGVSSGLVFFHFKSVDALLAALLEWVLERTVVAGEIRGLAAALGSPSERMMAIVRRDLERLPRQRARVELFFDYWVLGTRNPAIRRTIRAALDRYRNSFVPAAEDVVRSDPQRYAHVTPQGFAGVVAGFIEGCALQAVMDPKRFDVEQSMATLAALVAQPTPSAV